MQLTTKNCCKLVHTVAFDSITCVSMGEPNVLEFGGFKEPLRLGGVN